jgi:putative transposase
MRESRDGATYFVTFACFKRQPLLARLGLKQNLLNALFDTKKQFGLHLGGYVILDNHVHLLYIAPGSSEHPGPMNYLRARFSRAWRELETNVSDVVFWEHDIKSRILSDADDLRAHLDYIHYDPVRHGLCQRPCDYPWSSLRARIEQGHYTEEWGVLGPPASLARFSQCR